MEVKIMRYTLTLYPSPLARIPVRAERDSINCTCEADSLLEKTWQFCFFAIGNPLKQPLVSLTTSRW